MTKEITRVSLKTAIKKAKIPVKKSTLLRDAIDDIILSAFKAHDYKVQRTAAYLGIDRKTMRVWHERYMKWMESKNNADISIDASKEGANRSMSKIGHVSRYKT